MAERRPVAPPEEAAPLGVILVDHLRLFSSGLAALLDRLSDGRLTVLACTDRAGDAAELVRRHRPDLAVVDLEIGPPGGPATITAVKRLDATLRVAALAGDEHVDVVAALRAGANGFVLRSSGPEAVIGSMLAVASGLAVIPSRAMAGLMGSKGGGAGDLSRFAAHEVELWRLVARGLETAEIARRLFVSERTAKRMIASLLRRLGAANRVQAAALAGRAGLV